MGPGDDAAVLDGHAWTVDALVEGVHFDARLAPADVGFKAIAVSVSDLAAMGATPRWALLTLSLPRPVDRAWVAAFAGGVGEACRAFAVDLAGGDVTRSPGPRVVTTTLGGPCPAPVLRSGGRPGDTLWVTGVPGLAGLGYSLPDPPAAALDALRRPQPPVAFALAAASLVHAGMDLSDGLAVDLPRLCRASAVGAVVDPASLPDHPAFASAPDPLAVKLGGGDDYQLLLAAPPDARDALTRLAAEHGVVLSAVGRLTGEPVVRLLDGTWPRGLFDHFEEAGP